MSVFVNFYEIDDELIVDRSRKDIGTHFSRPLRPVRSAWCVSSSPHNPVQHSFYVMLSALATLLLFQCLGEGLSMLLALPVPGPVIGLLLLFAYLLARPGAVGTIEPTALELLRHLSLLFVPAGVGIMVAADRVRGSMWAIVVSLVVSTSLGIAVTALVTRALLRRQARLEASRNAP